MVDNHSKGALESRIRRGRHFLLQYLAGPLPTQCLVRLCPALGSVMITIVGIVTKYQGSKCPVSKPTDASLPMDRGASAVPSRPRSNRIMSYLTVGVGYGYFHIIRCFPRRGLCYLAHLLFPYFRYLGNRPVPSAVCA